MLSLTDLSGAQNKCGDPGKLSEAVNKVRGREKVGHGRVERQDPAGSEESCQPGPARNTKGVAWVWTTRQGTTSIIVMPEIIT